MNCAQIRERLPLYLSGEMAEGERAGFDTHLAACEECAHEIEAQREIDQRLRTVLHLDVPDTRGIERSVRKKIFAKQVWWQQMSAAVVVIVSVCAGLWLFRFPKAAMFEAAARDHRIEILEQQPRHWAATHAEMTSFLLKAGVPFETAASLAPQGYTLERAKFCGLDGQRMLHLVFKRGATSYSLYLRPQLGAPRAVRTVEREGEQVASFGTWRFVAFVVAEHGATDCSDLARTAESHL